MGYEAAKKGIKKYREAHISALMGEKEPEWLAESWGSIQTMLDDLTSDGENSDVGGMYWDGKSVDRVPAHMRLDYVCGIRREIRKQFISEDTDICTDVTPFRHGIMSAHGAMIFDDAMDQVLQKGDA